MTLNLEHITFYYKSVLIQKYKSEMEKERNRFKADSKTNDKTLGDRKGFVSTVFEVTDSVEVTVEVARNLNWSLQVQFDIEDFGVRSENEILVI